MKFHKIAETDELAEGGVKSVTVEGVAIALTRFEGQYAALTGRCPHAGGPLGEGEIDFGMLICPWHGREFHPHTGECQGFDDPAATYPVEARDDGIYVGL